MKVTEVRSQQTLSGAVKDGGTVDYMAALSLAPDKLGDISLHLTNNKTLPKLSAL